MAFFNYAKKELSAKIVYYGPGLSGKTTNLEVIHRRMRPDQRGKLISLDTQTDRTLFFDFLPLELGEIRGFKTRFHIYTVPGQVFYNATRKVVLKGVDGVVFVADSQRDMMESNIMSLKNLEANLEEQGRKVGELPVVLQYNKRDLPNLLSVKELDAALNIASWPTYEAAAISEKGVLETLTGICKLVLKDLRDAHEGPKKPARPAGPKPQPKPRLETPPEPAPAPLAAEPARTSIYDDEPIYSQANDEVVVGEPEMAVEEPMAARSTADEYEIVEESDLGGEDELVYVDDEPAPASSVAQSAWAEKPAASVPLEARWSDAAPVTALTDEQELEQERAGGRVEIATWGQPVRVSATTLRIPVTLRGGGLRESLTLSITVDLAQIGSNGNAGE